ncbi:MAG: toll/interleukin-1 receptor domain-containing protein [Bacteroidetes bacterium]|nr:toll/interleukin-1 receptor domain-containing protein [Bacteroidota bacterium]
MTEVFISLETLSDIELGEILKKWLIKTGLFNAEVIVRGHHPNEEIVKLIKEKIEGCKYFIPIITSESIYNQWVNQEIGYAIARDKQIWPLFDHNVRDQIRGFLNLTKIFDKYHGFDDYRTDNGKGIPKTMHEGAMNSYKVAASQLVKDLQLREKQIILSEWDESALEHWGKQGTIYIKPHKTAFFLLDNVIHPFQDSESVELLQKYTKSVHYDQYRTNPKHTTGKSIHFRPPAPTPPNPFKQ